jgi:hypothetical protein
MLVEALRIQGSSKLAECRFAKVLSLDADRLYYYNSFLYSPMAEMYRSELTAHCLGSVCSQSDCNPDYKNRDDIHPDSVITFNFSKTPRARFELATSRLTVDRSTTELPRITIDVLHIFIHYITRFISLASDRPNFFRGLRKGGG